MQQALLRGRLDLTQIEGLHDLIEADTEVQDFWAAQRLIVFFHIGVFSNLNVMCRDRPAQNMTLRSEIITPPN